MDRLREARHAINEAQKRGVHKQAELGVQMAIAHAMIAVVERMDKMLQLYDDKQNQLEMLAGN